MVRVWSDAFNFKSLEVVILLLLLLVLVLSFPTATGTQRQHGQRPQPTAQSGELLHQQVVIITARAELVRQIARPTEEERHIVGADSSCHRQISLKLSFFFFFFSNVRHCFSVLLSLNFSLLRFCSYYASQLHCLLRTVKCEVQLLCKQSNFLAR